MKRPPLLRQASGYSLIELLVAVLIISFGLLGVMTLQTQMLRASTTSEDGQRASLLASEMAASMLNANAVTLPASVLDTWTTKVSTPADGGLPNGVGTIDSTGTNSARITITWRPVQSTGATNDNHRYVTDVLIP